MLQDGGGDGSEPLWVTGHERAVLLSSTETLSGLSRMLDSLQLPAESGSLSFATNAAQAQGQPGAVAAKTPTRSTEHPNKVPGLNLQHIQQQQEGMSEQQQQRAAQLVSPRSPVSWVFRPNVIAPSTGHSNPVFSDSLRASLPSLRQQAMGQHATSAANLNSLPYAATPFSFAPGASRPDTWQQASAPYAPASPLHGSQAAAPDSALSPRRVSHAQHSSSMQPTLPAGSLSSPLTSTAPAGPFAAHSAQLSPARHRTAQPALATAPSSPYHAAGPAGHAPPGQPAADSRSLLAATMPSADDAKLQATVSQLRHALQEAQLAASQSAEQVTGLREQVQQTTAQLHQLQGTIGILESKVALVGGNSQPDVAASSAIQALQAQLQAQCAAAAAAASSEQQLRAELEDLRRQAHARDQAHAEERERLNKEAAQSRLLCRARARQVAEVERQLAELKQATAAATTSAQQAKDTASKSIADSMLASQRAAQQVQQAQSDMAAMRAELTAAQQACAAATARRDAMEAELRDVKLHMEWQEARMAELENQDETQTVRRYGAELQAVKGRLEQEVQRLETELRQERQKHAAAATEGKLSLSQSGGNGSGSFAGADNVRQLEEQLSRQQEAVQKVQQQAEQERAAAQEAVRQLQQQLVHEQEAARNQRLNLEAALASETREKQSLDKALQSAQGQLQRLKAAQAALVSPRQRSDHAAVQTKQQLQQQQLSQLQGQLEREKAHAAALDAQLALAQQAQHAKQPSPVRGQKRDARLASDLSALSAGSGLPAGWGTALGFDESDSDASDSPPHQHGLKPRQAAAQQPHTQSWPGNHQQHPAQLLLPKPAAVAVAVQTDETGVKPALGAKRENLLAAARDEILRLKDINSKLLDRGKDLELNHMLRADADAALVAAQQQSRQDLKEAVDRCEAVWAEKLAALEAQCVQLRSELAQACQQNQTLAAGLKADMDNAAAESTERLASLQGKLQVSVEECTKLQAAEAESADQLAASEAALQLSKEECMKLQAALEALKAEVQEQTQTLAAQAAELERVREEADADTAIAMLEASARSEGVSKRMSELKQDLEAAREAAVQEAQEAIQAERSLRLAAEQELAAARSAQSTAPACTDAAVQTDTPAAAARDAQQRSCSPALGSPEVSLSDTEQDITPGTSPESASSHELAVLAAQLDQLAAAPPDPTGPNPAPEAAAALARAVVPASHSHRPRLAASPAVAHGLLSGGPEAVQAEQQRHGTRHSAQAGSWQHEAQQDHAASPPTVYAASSPAPYLHEDPSYRSDQTHASESGRHGPEPQEYLQRLPAEESSHGTSPGSAAGPPTGVREERGREWDEGRHRGSRHAEPDTGGVQRREQHTGLSTGLDREAEAYGPQHMAASKMQGREDQILAYSSQDRRGGFSRHSDDQALMDHRLTDHHRSQDQPYASSRRRSLARYSDHGSAALTHAELDRRHRSHVAGLSRYPIRDVMPLREAEQLQEMHRRLTADSAAGSAQRNTLSSSYHGNVLAGPAYDSYPEAMRHRSIEDARTPIKAHTLRLHSTSPDPPLSSSHSRRRSSHSSYDPVTRDRNGAGGSPGGSLAAAQLRLDCLEARVQQPLVEDQVRQDQTLMQRWMERELPPVPAQEGDMPAGDLAHHAHAAAQGSGHSMANPSKGLRPLKLHSSRSGSEADLTQRTGSSADQAYRDSPFGAQWDTFSTLLDGQTDAAAADTKLLAAQDRRGSAVHEALPGSGPYPSTEPRLLVGLGGLGPQEADEDDLCRMASENGTGTPESSFATARQPHGSVSGSSHSSGRQAVYRPQYASSPIYHPRAHQTSTFVGSMASPHPSGIPASHHTPVSAPLRKPLGSERSYSPHTDRRLGFHNHPDAADPAAPDAMRRALHASAAREMFPEGAQPGGGLGVQPSSPRCSPPDPRRLRRSPGRYPRDAARVSQLRGSNEENHALAANHHAQQAQHVAKHQQQQPAQRAQVGTSPLAKIRTSSHAEPAGHSGSAYSSASSLLWSHQSAAQDLATDALRASQLHMERSRLQEAKAKQQAASAAIPGAAARLGTSSPWDSAWERQRAPLASYTAAKDATYRPKDAFGGPAGEVQPAYGAGSPRFAVAADRQMDLGGGGPRQAADGHAVRAVSPVGVLRSNGSRGGDKYRYAGR